MNFNNNLIANNNNFTYANIQNPLYNVTGFDADTWTHYLNEISACATSFLPNDYQITQGSWGKNCATTAQKAYKKLSKITDYFETPLKKTFNTVFSFQSFPKLPTEISNTKTSDSAGATLLMTATLASSTLSSFLSLFRPVPNAAGGGIKKWGPTLFSSLKGSLIGSGSSLLFGQNPYTGAAIGALSMPVMEGISYYTTKLQSYALYTLGAMGIMNCAQILHQDFANSEQNLESFAMDLMTGNSLTKLQVQSASNELRTLSWKLPLYLYSLPYSITSYLSLAAQSSNWRIDILEKKIPKVFNQTPKFIQTASLESFDVCKQIKPITPKTFYYIPEWCSNSNAMLKNIYKYAVPIWNNTTSFLQEQLFTNTTQSANPKF